MRFIIAIMLLGIVLIYFLLRGEKGLMVIREAFVDLTSDNLGRWFVIAGGASGIILAIMILSGHNTFKELIDMDRMMIEQCPYCM